MSKAGWSHINSVGCIKNEVLGRLSRAGVASLARVGGLTVSRIIFLICALSNEEKGAYHLLLRSELPEIN